MTNIVAEGARPKRTTHTDPAALRNRVTELRAELVDTRAELARERDERGADAEVIGKLMARIAELEGAALALSKPTRRPGRELSEARLEIAAKEIETLAEGLRAAVARAEDAEQRLAEEQSETLRLRAELETMSGEAAAGAASVDEALRQLDAERHAIQDAEIRLASSEDRANWLAAHADELEAERARTEGAIVGLRDELERRRVAAVDARVALEAEAERAATLEARIAALEVELLQARDQSSRLATRVGELTPLATGIESARAQASALKRQLSAREDEAALARQEHERELASAQAALGAFEARHAEMRSGVGEMVDAAATVAELLEELERRDLDIRELRARSIALASRVLEQTVALEHAALSSPPPEAGETSEPEPDVARRGAGPVS